MESNRRRRRRRRDKKPKKTLQSSSSPIAGGATSRSSTVHDVPDHLLEVILLRVDSYVSLIRAASTCKRWCRIVADHEFLRRLHPQAPAPLILGHHYYYYHYYADPEERLEQELVFVPSSTTSIHESMSLDFVPKLDGDDSEVADTRDTLLLLSKPGWMTRTRSSSSNPDLVVCRPVTRRYKAISVPRPDQLAGRQCLGLFLVDGEGGSSIGLSNFKVIAVLLRDHMLVPHRGVPEACVYGVYEGRWGWRDVSCTWSGGDISIPNRPGYFAGRANGCLYWAIESAHAALAVDEATMEVWLVALPGDMHWYGVRRRFRFLGGEEEEEEGAVAPRAVELMDNDLRVYATLAVGDGYEWVLQNLVPLPVVETCRRDAVFLAAHETYVIVRPRDSARILSVDLETMAVEVVPQGIMDSFWDAFPYELPWPPSLEAAAADNSDPHTEDSTYGFHIPYSLLKATQNIARLSFSVLGLLVSFCSNKILGQ